MENNGVDLDPEPVNLEELIQQVLSSLKLVFEKAQAQIQFNKTGSDFTVVGGSAHLISVIYNLLDNALNILPINQKF
ncbi:MAG: hypothetical protein U5K54_28135 [Cytophagales bacterium]|nr:hypothetical protein [Cytophagales bacterium]